MLGHFGARIFLALIVLTQRPHRLQRRPWADGTGAVPDQGGQVVDIPRVAGLDDQVDLGAQAAQQQMLVNGAQGEQHRNGRPGTTEVAIGDDEQLCAATDRVMRRLT